MGRALFAAIIAATLLVPAHVASALENEDVLALVAMPLAVAAVSEMTEVPSSELIDVVTLMNDAAVTPSQFIEVVRYIPAALVAGDTKPDFVEFVRVQAAEGLRGEQLVTAIADQMPVYGLPEVDLAVTRLRTIDVTEATFVPSPVRKRLAVARASHPHGGPPGQLKKAAGMQTGAEIVHRDRGNSIAKPRVDDHRGRGKGHGHSKGNGRGNGKG